MYVCTTHCVGESFTTDMHLDHYEKIAAKTEVECGSSMAQKKPVAGEFWLSFKDYSPRFNNRAKITYPRDD